MARQVKHNIEGCWYHITARGMGRREIYLEDRDLERFTELPQGLVERCGIVLHAYVLMDNHNHLLVETPHANASRALRWLNVSCAAWFNAQHTAGRAPYSSSATRASQSTARAHGLWRRVGTGKSKEDGKVEYRRYLEDCLRQGVEEGAFARITSAVAIGGADFVERLRRKVPPSARCDTNARAWRRLLPFGEVVKAVEAAKGESGVKWLWRNVRRRGLNFFSSDRRGLLNF